MITRLTRTVRLLTVYSHVEAAKIKLSQIEERLIDVLGFDDLVNQITWHGFACFMMA